MFHLCCVSIHVCAYNLMDSVFHLQLEENVRIIALSGDWIKLVDDWLVESCLMQNATSIVGTTQKRALSARRNRKQSASCEVTADSCHEKSFIWWQGGKQSKLIFQKAILPHSMVKRAARQGSFLLWSNLFSKASQQLFHFL